MATRNDRGQTPLGAQAETTAEARTGRANGADHTARSRSSRGVENSIAYLAPERSKETRAAANESGAPNEVKRSEESSRAMPGHIATRYVVVDNKYHFPNGGAPAFTDHTSRLTTRLENTEVIADLVAIAKERGWDNVALTGTKTFKAEAWQQANLAGLTVRGYRPSKLEEAMLERRREAQIDPSRASGAARDGADSARSGAGGEALREASRLSEQTPVRGGVFKGRLVESGFATYPNDPDGQESFYVKLQERDKERILWGKDLERALYQSKSRVQTGDEVTVRFEGSEPVVITRPVRNPQNEIIREERIQGHLNRWSVENSDFVRERAELARTVRDTAVTKEDAVRKYPSLSGVYTELHMAGLKAIQQFKAAEDRTRFLAQARERLASDIERGENLPVTRGKPRKATQAASARTARDLVQERTL